MPYVHLIDFKDENTKFIDWDAFYRARIANGDDCKKCGGSIFFGGKGSPSLCEMCASVHNHPGIISHHSRIRCPECGTSQTIDEVENNNLYNEGVHDAVCSHCDCDFKVKTSVSYSFESPALLNHTQEHTPP